MFTHFHQRIAEKKANMAAAPVLIVALGDSVTHGIMELNVIDQQAVYHHQLWKMLIARHPSCVFSVLNAGVGGDNAPGALNAKLRDELLNREIFETLLEAKVLIEVWRVEYNTVRPHSSLGYRPPAPEAIAPSLADLRCTAAGRLDPSELTCGSTQGAGH